MKRLIPALLCLIVAGCGGKETETKPAKTDDKTLAKATPNLKAIKKEDKAPAQKTVELIPIKLQDLLARIGEEKGKIVVVDLWGTFCIPCKEEFPNLIKLHHDYAGKGVVCMSLSIDDAADKKEALKFLQEQKAVIPNFLLAEDTEIAQKHWDFEPVPVCVVYGKDGKLARRFRYSTTENFTYKDVEAFVEALVAGKTPPPPPKIVPKEAPKEKEAPKKGAGKIELKSITMDELLNKQVPSHKGKIVVLDIWATICPPCVAEFPNLVALHKNYRDKNVVCMAMTLNEKEDLGDAQAFLEKHQAEFTNFWLPDGFDGVRKVWKFDAIPVVVVFNRDGKIAHIYRGKEANYKEVEKLVQKLITAS